MMHELLRRLAQYGGEGALGTLFLLSIVNLGLISQSVWHFVRRRFNAEVFAKQLAALLRADDFLRAEALAQQADASVCCVALAGLFESGRGLHAVRHALDNAISRERTKLEEPFGAMVELGRLAVLIGILGSLFDLLMVGNPAAVSAFLPALAPTIGGLLVAIPAWIAKSLLALHVQRIVRECEFVAKVTLSQLTPVETATAVVASSAVHSRRVAA